MAGVTLYDYQYDSLCHMKNGCILNGGVGSGKSRTALAYYYTLYGGIVYYVKKNNYGQWDFKTYYKNNGIIEPNHNYIEMNNPDDLYIITTARKRDTGEWESELVTYLLSTHPENNLYKNKVVVDSWNNIERYSEIKNAFFIFDEQRVVGSGKWTKMFLRITKSNKWILLSATPGDCWMDYAPVFIANGYFKNRTDFINRHAVYDRFSTYPRIDRYVNEGYLIKLKREILISMDCVRTTERHHEYIKVNYDKIKYDRIDDTRWNPFKDKPIENASEYCYCLRQVVNSDISRMNAIMDILNYHMKVIIFYSYDYELEILRNHLKDFIVAEWNGHKHEKIPEADRWIYLVEYIAGSEGWNCTQTDTIIFYSQNYSYKVLEQSCGRIDRVNTKFRDLYYYHLVSDAKIDRTISMALKRKKKFNERGFAPVFNTEKKEEKSKNDILNYCTVYNSWEHKKKEEKI